MMAKQTFKDAIDAAEDLRFQQGLQAIKKSEGAGKITAKNPRRVLGSVCIDDDCLHRFPNDSRWDYVIGYERSSKPVAYFVEVHSAETSEVSKVEAKLAWLLDYLRDPTQKQLAKLDREIHWVASGRINIPRHTPQYKKLSTTLRRLKLQGPAKELELA